MKSVSFYVITDTHYFSEKLNAYGEAYERYMDTQQKCFAETAAINQAVFRYLENTTDTDIILIAGDLSFNGEKESHIEFSQMLKKLKDKGKKVYVVTAAHDITLLETNTPGTFPVAYDENGKKQVEGISYAELLEYYHDYGYDQAIAFKKENLSYVAQIADGVRLLVLCNDTKEGVSEAYSEDMLQWIKEQAQLSQKEGQLMIAMEHYPVLPGQPFLSLISDARQKESKKLIETLADNGVHLIFTGHMHNQSINVVETEKGNLFYDVCTGSTIGYPAFMRYVTIENESTVSVKSIPVPEFSWPKKTEPGNIYMKKQFERMIRYNILTLKDHPESLLGNEKKALCKIVKKVAMAIATWSNGKIARSLCVKCDKTIKNESFLELVIDVVRSMFEGDQPFVEDTPKGDFLLRIVRRFKPILSVLNKKVHGAQGEDIDFYDLFKNSIGNYGISDYDAVLVLK